MSKKGLELGHWNFWERISIFFGLKLVKQDRLKLLLRKEENARLKKVVLQRFTYSTMEHKSIYITSYLSKYLGSIED